MTLRGLVAWLLIGVLLVAGAAAPQAVQAQPAIPPQAAPPDYAEWEALARRAEAALESAAATDLALEELRERVAEQRARFLAEQDANRARIRTVRGQLEALGPEPGDARPEADDIAERRAELQEQLARLRAPVLQAEEAFQRADGLIREIDNELRERQTDALVQLWPAPVNPANWEFGARAVGEIVAALTAELRRGWESPPRRAELSDNLPIIAVYLIVALGLVLRGRRWVALATTRLQRNLKSRRARHGCALVVSVGHVVLPVLGVLALVQAIEATGLIGQRGGALVSALPAAGFAYFAARWLGGLVFRRNERGFAIFNLPHERLREGRFHCGLMGIALALDLLRGSLVDPAELSEAANGVIQFPILLLATALMVRMGQVIGQHTPVNLEEDESPGYFDRMVRVGGRLLMALGLVAALLAAVGYVAAANALIFPTLMSLALIGLLLVVQMMISDLYALFMGQDSGDEALIPVLFGFALSVLAVPVFALIWGVRESAMRELWARFREGLELGETRLSPSDLVTFAVVFGAIFVMTRLLQGALRGSILPKTSIDKGGRNAIVSGTGYIGIFLAAMVGITSAGIDLSSFALVAGALSVGIGFGLQNIVSNFVAGIILLIERPVSEGDWIEVSGTMGIVRAIEVRSTVIETFDRTDVIVPNADLISQAVTNWTRLNLTGRLTVRARVAYGSDTRKVERILQEVAADQPLAVLKPPPMVLFRAFGDDGLEFEVRVILRDINFVLDVHSDMNHEIARRFAAEGIEIPFAQRDLWLRNAAELAAPAASAPSPQPPRAPRRDRRSAAPSREDMDDLAADFDTDASPEGDT